MKDAVEFHDLKCRNIVKCRVSNDAGIYSVIALDGLNHKVMLDGARQGTWYDIEQIRAIPIEAKYLLNADYKKIDTDGISYYELFESPYCFYTGDKNGFIEVIIEANEHDIKRLKYMHELQNAHWFLLGRV